MSRPASYAPMLAVGRRPPPTGHVVIEPKWDGMRAIVTVYDGRVTIRSRSGTDATAGYPELHRPPDALADRSVVVDGEIVALGHDGLPNFQRLQRRMHVRRPSSALVAEVPVVLIVFDLLWLDGDELVGRPLTARRQQLEQLDLAGAWEITPRFTPPLTDELVEGLREAGFEGVVVKDERSIYRPGERSPAWVKVKARQKHLAVIGGILVEGTRSHAGSLAVGMQLDGQLRYVGQIGNALRRPHADQLARFLDTIPADHSPFADLDSPRLRWVEPHVVVEVEFTEVTSAGTFRQPVLQRVVLDVPAGEVVADGHFAEAIRSRAHVDVGDGQRL